MLPIRVAELPILYWYLPGKDGKSKLRIFRDEKWWIAKLREDWWDECRISPKQFDRACAKLEDEKFIETAVFNVGGISTKHIWLNIENVLQRVKAVLPKGQFTPAVNHPKVNSPITQTSSAYKEAETTNTENTKDNPSFSDSLFGEESNGKPKRHTRVLEKTCDPRCKAVTAKIFEAYKHSNKVNPGWGDACGKQLKNFLAAHPD